MSRPPVLKLGLVGLPSDWEERYAPALARLGNRAELVGVYDSIPARADHVAGIAQTASFHGIRPLCAIPGLKGLLLLDSGWQRNGSLSTLAAAGLPLFVGQEVLRALDDWTALPAALKGAESIIVPECLLRYQPSMLRLRELMATRLGAVKQVSFVLPLARTRLDRHLAVREVCNWFRTTFEVIASQVTISSDDAEARNGTTIELRCPTRTGRSISFTLHGGHESSHGDEITSGDDAAPFCTVTCEAGVVELLGPRELKYQLGDEGASETLDADRSATDVALDLFARRALGGLLPVPDLTHLEQAQRFAAGITGTSAAD